MCVVYLSEVYIGILKLFQPLRCSILLYGQWVKGSRSMLSNRMIGSWAMRLTVLVGLLWIILGCGGGGGGGKSASPTPVNSSVSVAWPVRSKSIIAPSSGLSVKFLLHDPTGKQTDVSWIGNRSTNVLAHTETYASTTTLLPGKFVLSGVFYASADALGVAVATFGANVSVTSRGTVADANGSPLTPIQFTGSIHSVVVAASQIVTVGSNTTQLAASALDANGSVVAISPGSYQFAIASGRAFLSLTPAGVASGLAKGTANVTVTVDGLTSAPTSVSVVGSTTTSVSVAWPERSRSINGPSSALSVKLLLHDPSGVQNDITWTGNRSTDLSAHTETYQTPTQCIPGTYGLSGTFYSTASLSGIIVANFSVNVAVQQDGTLTNPDGSTLGTVQFIGLVKSVVVPSGQSVLLGSTTTQLSVGALDVNGSPLAVSPGSFIFSVTGGASTLSITKSGVAHGLHLGSATVQATVDGLVSSPTAVTVYTQQNGLQTYNLDSNDICYDAARNLLYVSTASDSPIDPSEVVLIDLTTNQITNQFSIGRVPTALALSGDGNHLFIGSDSGIITRVNLTTLATDATVNVYTTVQNIGGQLITKLFTLPGTTDSFIVLTVDSNYSPRPNNLAIIDSGVARPNMASLGPQVSVDSSGSQAFGTDDYITPNGYSSATINAQGFTGAAGGSLGSLGASTTVCWTPYGVAAAGYLGMPVMSATTGSQIGNIPNLPGYKQMAWEPGTSKVFYAYWNVGGDPYLQIQTGDINALTTVGSPYSLGNPAGGVGRIIYAGLNRAAIRMFGSSANTVIVAGGLP